MLTFKAHVFGDFGKVLLKIGSAFSDSLTRKKHTVMSAGGNEKNVVLTPAERTEALAKVSLNVEQAFYRIEKRFREGLIKTAIYDTQNPIQETFLHPMVEPEKPRGNQTETPKETNAPRALPAAAFSTGGTRGSQP